MAEVTKDPAIKLFGRTICLNDAQFSENSDSLENVSSATTKAETEDGKNDNSRTMEEAASVEPCKVEQPQTSVQKSNSECDQEESDDSEEPKLNKRPDKIVPCPRCNSSDTKFCYFNNYNVNQPRHFCKSCQRYWTAGGTVRNVPVGAGRRRNKHLASQYRQILVSSDVGPTTVVETSDPRNQLLSCEEPASSCTASIPNKMVLKFGPESPHCDSVPNSLNQNQRKGCSDINLHNYSLHENGIRVINSDLSLQQPLHSSLPRATTLTSSSNGSEGFMIPGCSAQSTPSISVQYVPASYWNYIPVWVAGSGNLSLAVSSNGRVSPPFFSSANGVQVLGKHPRDLSEGEMTGEGVPSSKTHRIRNFDEA